MLRLLKVQNKNAYDVVPIEKMLFEFRKENKIPDTIWVWEHPRCLYLTNTGSVLFIDLEYLKNNNYPVVRSAVFPGKNTSAVLAGTDYGLLMALNKNTFNIQNGDDFMDKFYFDMFKQILIGVDLKNTGNDFVVNGTDKKMMGLVVAEDGEYIAGHQTLLNYLPTDIDIDLVYKLPPEKFADKTVKKPSERMTSYEIESGQRIDYETLFKGVEDYLTSLGIEYDIAEDFTELEKEEVEKLRDKYLTDEWINYGRFREQPDFIQP